MLIREVKISDLSRYVSLRKACLKSYSMLAKEDLMLSDGQLAKTFRKNLKDKDKLTLVVENKGDIIGYVDGMLIKNAARTIGYIDDLYVSPESRSKGVGRDLITQFIVWAKKKKATKTRLGVRSNNVVAIRLYKKMGFKQKTDFIEMEK